MLRLLYVLFILIPALVYGQTDSLYTLPTATIRSTLPTNLVEWDSTHLQRLGNSSLTAQLQHVPEVYVRNYGPGSLGTISLLGGSSSHTGIKWEGIPLRNPMLGQNDLSLMPTQIFDEIAVDVAGASAEHGNAQLNGTILLTNGDESKPGLVIAPEVGEWARWGGWSKANWRKGSLRSQLKIYGQRSDNDFRYRRTSGELAQQSNARVRNFGILQSNQWVDRRDRAHRLALWWQNALQHIPPLTTQNSSEAVQRTKSSRGAFTWNDNGVGTWPSVTLGWVHENIHFRDPRNNIDSPSSYHSASLQVTRQFQLKGSARLRIGVHEQVLTASIKNYGQDRSENQLELYGIYSHRIGRWHYRLALRQGLTDTKLMPTSASLRINHPLGNGFQMHLSLSRDTRFVTLNERYWIPGGNADLSEESSLAQMIKVTFQTRRKGTWKVHIMGFNRYTYNWIQWTPVGNSFIWSPSNLSSVWSRGLTMQVAHEVTAHKVKLFSLANYSLTRSTNQDDITLPRLQAGEQIWYTPIHQFTFEQKLRIKEIQLIYRHKFTGPYNGIREPVASFHLAQLRMEWDKPANSRLLKRVWLLVDNLFNEDYRMIENRPMPLRNIRIGLHLQIA